MLKEVGHKRTLLYATVLTLVFTAPQQIAATTIAPAPATTESFDVGTLHVDQYGRGKPALILIPGLASGTWSWYGTITHFAPRYTVYALTLAGFDGRPAVNNGPLFATFSTDFNHLLDLRNIEKPIVMGHSLGGTLAIMIGEQDGNRLKAIVAVDGLPVFPAVANLSESDRKAYAKQSAEPVAKLTPSEEVAYEQRFMRTIGTIDPAFADSAAQREARSDPTAIAQWLQADVSADLRPDLSKISVPLLEIMPYYAPDHQHPPLQFTQAETLEFYQSLLAGAPHVTVVPISDSRHFVMFDQPQAFYTAVERFIDAL